MDWLGIGVLVLGIAFFALVIFLIKPLNKLAGVLSNVQKTTDGLPQQLEEITTQTKVALKAGNDTLNQINDQIRELSPIFGIIGDAGRATNHLSSSMVDAVMKVKTDTSEGKEFIQRNHLEGLYGLATLGYYIFQKRKSIASSSNTFEM